MAVVYKNRTKELKLVGHGSFRAFGAVFGVFFVCLFFMFDYFKFHCGGLEIGRDISCYFSSWVSGSFVKILHGMGVTHQLPCRLNN